MKFYQSLRFRLVATLLIFGALLVIVNGMITFFLMGRNVGRLVDNFLETEIDYFLYQYEKDRTTPLPHSKFITAFRGLDQVPEKFSDLFENLEPGVHAFRPQSNRPPVHVGVVQLPDTKADYYLIFQGRAFFKENDFLTPLQILMLSLALLLIPGTIIGIFATRTLFRPMKPLMEKIRDLRPDKIPEQWVEGSREGELGMLTANIESAMTRIREFITREKQFTRDASHELRTPLTIVKGAVEIMETQPEIEANPLLKNPLDRISKSVRDMEITIETFLWLAREENDAGETCQVDKAVNKAVDNTRHLIENKEVEVNIEIRDNPTLGVKEEILYIAVANLVRNAFQFTTRGSITIVSESHGLSITDTGMGIEPKRLASVTKSHIKGEQSQGFGLGLGIVSRLCRRFGWEFEICSRPGEGTRVEIQWNAET